MFTSGKISRIFALSGSETSEFVKKRNRRAYCARKCNFRELSIDSVAVAERNNYAGVELRHGGNVAGKFN